MFMLVLLVQYMNSLDKDFHRYFSRNFEKMVIKFVQYFSNCCQNNLGEQPHFEGIA